MSAGLAQRARILVLAAEGDSNTEIGWRVGVSLPTVRMWRERYATGGLEQLDDEVADLVDPHEFFGAPARPPRITAGRTPI